ncbi:dihydrodipicolinate synthase family protein [Natronogracilivirga saccharolytica]|uniref:Dihydrodipicolinate synthase family protein n=1 Tax=Natronogracilivirga saccharolytica TaxID=2812953 RepID=A0A8J7S8E8_9BACT|nr:dihydrodipicolinate synthase family protein [Natronogracilivirga saccharolytica]MBP3193873.1 dihydrodipicolinate synthase family protein [Natronogracilivirga saccharolytica]
MKYPELEKTIKQHLIRGMIIPAHPLAINPDRSLNERRQRALTRYYIASGAGGLAVGVHTTQFEIRDKDVNLLEPVLRLAAEEMDAVNDRLLLKIAGICGETDQAVREAELAVQYGYHMGLLSMGGLQHFTEADLLERAKKVALNIPVFGFYLQPAVGGRVLSYSFWKEFIQIPGVYAIKVAPFNRYQTQDVIRAVAESERNEDIALYTGNDDNILVDLLTTFRFNIDGRIVEKRFAGGLLGHWAIWTSKVSQLFEELRNIPHDNIPAEYLTLAAEITDANAAVFDVANNFKGCIAGIHEVLRRQGLLEGIWCLDSCETLSPGQKEEIDRIYRNYPHMQDDDFVRKHLDEFLG